MKVKAVFAKSGLEYAKIRIQEALETQEECYRRNTKMMFEGAPADAAACHAFRECLNIIESAECWEPMGFGIGCT